MKTSVAGIALKNGALFIARRLEGGDMGCKWEFPGGKVEEGEDCKTALKREFAEELAVPVCVGEFIGSVNFVHKGVERCLKAYLVEIESFDFTLKEHSLWRWASIDEIKKLDFTPSDLALLPCIKGFLEKVSC